MIAIRSLLYHISFYLMSVVLAVATIPILLVFSERGALSVARLWANIAIFLLRVLAGTKVEIRGAEHLPTGGAIIASKHQSTFETIGLFPLLPYPSFVMKQQLRRIPIIGRFTAKTGMIHVDRSGKAAALRALTERAGEELAKGRQIVIFPEGTRRPPGAEPAYQTGIALIYRKLDAPVIPVALNSGLYWPRRGFFRYPGTIIMEILPPIGPGLDSRTFLKTLEQRIESASDVLLAEAASSTPRPPIPPEAKAHLARKD
jgi:1-acyl-sn-glycerol-3-phosphate acyltransferase